MNACAFSNYYVPGGEESQRDVFYYTLAREKQRFKTRPILLSNYWIRTHTLCVRVLYTTQEWYYIHTTREEKPREKYDSYCSIVLRAHTYGTYIYIYIYNT